MDAATPALGYAANVISICALIFLALVIAFIFWLGGLVEKGKEAHGHAPAPALAGGSDAEG